MADRKAFVTETTTTVRGKKYPRFVCVYWTEDGTRKRASRKTRAEAEALAKQHNRDAARREEGERIKRRYLGEEEARRFPIEKYRDAVDALAILEGAATLTETARFFMDERARRARRVPTIAELADDYLKDAESAGLRFHSIRDLRHRLKWTVERFGPCRVDEVTTGDVREWLDNLTKQDGKTPVSDNTRKHFRFAARGLFKMAVERQFIESNPANIPARRRKRTSEAQPGILTVDQARKILTQALQEAPDAVPGLALSLFAGTRATEMRRLDWADIDLSAGIVKISPKIAKKRSVRNVTIVPNLAKWLCPRRQTEGAIWPHSESLWTKAIRDLASKAGITDWPHNALRHSFGSYHVALHEDPSKTAWEMGHRDSGDLLFENYRQLVTKAEAERFFSIEPPSQNDRVQPS